MMKIAIRASDKALQRKLIRHLNKRLPELVAKKVYPLEAIVGLKYWIKEPESHISLGRCFSDLVNKGRIPFVKAGFTSDRHDKYRFTGL